MHILTLTAPVNLGKPVGILEAGEWIMADQNAFEIANMAARGTAKLRPFSMLDFPAAPQGENDNRPTLIVRSGAIGDLLMLTPIFVDWATQTGEWFNLCCFPHHFPLFDGNSDVRILEPYPLALREVYRFKQIVSLENTMELDHTRHPTDIFRTALGIGSLDLISYKPIYNVKVSEKLATQKYLFSKRPNIALQLKASVGNRDYPLPHWLTVIQGLEERGWGVLLLGAKGQLPELPPHLRTPFIRDLSRAGLTIRESAAVLSQCNGLIGIDSAFLHFAHALDIPAIGLFGPFPWQIRSANAPLTKAISGTGECAGCCWHRHNGRIYPPGKPCSTPQTGYCVVLASIPPARVVMAAERLKPKS